MKPFKIQLFQIITALSVVLWIEVLGMGSNSRRNTKTDNFSAFQVKLLVLRESNLPLFYDSELKNSNSAKFQRIADKAENGINSIFCPNPRNCDPLYVGSQLLRFEPSFSSDRNVQIVISLYWRQQYKGGVQAMQKILYESLAANNGFLGSTDLFVGPIESITKSYTYAMPIMKINGQPVSYSSALEDPNHRQYIFIVEVFTTSMDQLFRSSPDFANTYFGCTVKDLDPLPPPLRHGISVTYTIFVLQNYTLGPTPISNFIKQQFTSQPTGCLLRNTLCSAPANNEYDLTINIVRKGFKPMSCPNNQQTQDYARLKSLFEQGMKQVINASPNIRSYIINVRLKEVRESVGGCLFRYIVTLQPAYKGNDQILDSELSKTINKWGRNCLGSSNLCVDKIPGECSVGDPTSCGDLSANQACVLEAGPNGIKRTVCRCKPGYVKTSPLGPCFPSTCDINDDKNSHFLVSKQDGHNSGVCGGRSQEVCTFNPKTVQMECGCSRGWKRLSPEGPCIPAQCELGTNVGCYANQECFLNNVDPQNPRLECRCKPGFIQLNEGGACFTRVCDPGTNNGCGPNEICRYDPKQHRQPVCECAPGFYRITSNHLPSRSRGSTSASGRWDVGRGRKDTTKGISVCVQGLCDPIQNTGCRGPNEVCTFSNSLSSSFSDEKIFSSSRNTATTSKLQIYCACEFGFIRTHVDAPCLRNLCDPRTHAGCQKNQVCALNTASNQYECQCTPGHTYNIHSNECQKEVCNIGSGAGCEGPNEICIADKIQGTRCECRPGFIRHPQNNNFCTPNECGADGQSCGPNEECVFINESNNRRLQCQCQSGFIKHPQTRQCVRVDCDINTNQGCRQNEVCIVLSGQNNGLPFCECKSPQFYRIGDVCVPGNCNPLDNSGCGPGQICKIDNSLQKLGDGPKAYCVCAKGYLKVNPQNLPANGGIKSSELGNQAEICVPAECSPYAPAHTSESSSAFGSGKNALVSENQNFKVTTTLFGQCPFNERCAFVLNKIGKAGQYKCVCNENYIRIPAETGICYRAECEPATNRGCNKPEICSLIGNIVKCICPYNYRKLSDHPGAPCVYATCDPISNEGCGLNEVCRAFPAKNEIKCVCIAGYVSSNDEECVEIEKPKPPAEVIEYCKFEDEQLIKCPPYSECIIINGVPLCRCLPGYIKDNAGNCIGKWDTTIVTPTYTWPTVPPVILNTTLSVIETTEIITKTSIIILPTCDTYTCGPNQLCKIGPDGLPFCECIAGYTQGNNGTCILIPVTTGVTDAIILPCDDEYCTYHGVCRLNADGTRYCECERWWIGRQCQHNGRLIAILAPLLLGLLLLLCCCLLPLCWWFSRRRKRRLAENMQFANEGLGDYGKMVPYTIPRPMVAPETLSVLEQEREIAPRGYVKPEETTEITEETTTEEWKRTYKRPKKRPLVKRTLTEDIIEEETAEMETGAVETDNENDVYISGGGQRWIKGNGGAQNNVQTTSKPTNSSSRYYKEYSSSSSTNPKQSSENTTHASTNNFNVDSRYNNKFYEPQPVIVNRLERNEYPDSSYEYREELPTHYRPGFDNHGYERS